MRMATIAAGTHTDPRTPAFKHVQQHSDYIFNIPNKYTHTVEYIHIYIVFIKGPVQLSRYSDSLRARRSGDRIPVRARFSAPVPSGSVAYPASYTIGTESFSGVKQPGRGVDHTPPSRAETEERVELYLYSSSGPSWPVLG